MYDPNDPDNMPRNRLAAEVKALREIARVAREVLIVCNDSPLTGIQAMAMTRLDAALKSHELALAGAGNEI